MRIGLDSPPRRAFFLISVLLITLPYLFWIQVHFRASLWAQSIHLQGLERAARLDPSNSDYHHRLGRYHLFISQDPQAASADFQAAIALNRNASRYWMDLATAQRVLGNHNEQQYALEQALRIDPKTPLVAWEAGNFFLADGQLERALDSFKVVIENDPITESAALDLCWRATHDADLVLKHAMPAQVEPHLAFIAVLTQQRQSDAAMSVWRDLVRLNQPFKVQMAIPFVQFLINQRRIESAQEVWAGLARLSPSLRASSTDGNLITNGDFEEDIIPGGMSWNLNFIPETLTVQLDDREFHKGSSSLLLNFKGTPFDESGISQLVAVKPNSRYELLVDVKSQEIESANGPRVLVADAFTNVTIASGVEWQGTHVWSQDSITFTAGSNTRLVKLFIGRSPSFGLIRGRMWIDNVRMFER
jgi:tetratricopeptide (TPR) repeat protein